MTKDELKDIIFSGVILDRYRRASMEQFIDETDDLTIDNFMEKYYEWVNSGKNKKVFEQVHKEDMDEEDAKIKVGINAISRKDYTSSNDPDTFMRFKMDKVRCNSTGLYGIITANGEEIVPCIFEYINIHLDGYVEAKFKDLKCTIMSVNREMAEEELKEDDNESCFVLYDKGALMIRTDVKNPTSKQLFELISK